MNQCNTDYIIKEELDDDISLNLKKIFFAIWNRKFLIIKVFITVFLLMILSTFIMPKKYLVDSDLYINKSNSSNMAEINPFFISEVGTGSGMAAMLSGGNGVLSNEIELIQSPLVIDKVIKENDLRVKKLFGIIKTKKYGQYVKTEKFIKKLNIENKKGTNVVTISYKNKDKDLAYNVVNSIINNYIQLHKELNTEKSQADKLVLETEYNRAKTDLDKKMKSISGLPSNAMAGAGNITAMSAFSRSAQRAMSNIQGQYVSGIKSEIALREEAEKVAELAKKLEWAKLVENMSDTSNVIILKEPQRLQEFEQDSPKLFTNILLGIVFGFIISLIALIIKEINDKKLTYSMLGNEIIYNTDKDFIDLRSILLAEKNKKISIVAFEALNEALIKEFQKFKNINYVKADISEEFDMGVEDSEEVIIAAAIGQTDSKLYKRVKQLLERMNKKVITEVLV